MNNPELYQEILDVLKEFDPGIFSINYDDGGTLGRGGYYKILSKENNRALPLDMYGDGMKKALAGGGCEGWGRDYLMLF